MYNDFLNQDGLPAVEMAAWNEDREPTPEEAKLAKICLWIAILCWLGMIAIGLMMASANATPLMADACRNASMVTHDAQAHGAIKYEKMKPEDALLMLATLIPLSGQNPDDFQVPVSGVKIVWDDEIEIAWFNDKGCALPQFAHLTQKQYDYLVAAMAASGA